jgi:DNA-directed RNA polymerase specialized sigma subunit
MKIALSQDEVANLSASGAHAEELAKAVGGCRIGDWEAKHALERLFAPLLAMLADKRAGDDNAARNELIERGRAGLYRAAKRFPRRDPIRLFRLFALDHIEAAMDKPASRLPKIFG